MQRFLFEGLSPDPAGECREVVVRFDYDVNGIARVSARDRRTNRAEGITITPSDRQLAEARGARANGRVAGLDRRLERKIDGLLRRAERLMTRLEANGESEAAEAMLSLAGDLERARHDRDYEQARLLMEELSELVYQQEG